MMNIYNRLDRAEQLYRERARAGAVKESVSVLTAIAESSERYEVQWRLARALFFLGQEAGSTGPKRQLHAAAIDAAESASVLSPERVEGHFWLGVNLALFAESAGGIKAARALLRARTELKRAAAISEEYHGAGPLRVLGRLEHKAPLWLGASRKRSRRYFDRALQIAPANSVTLVYAAELSIYQREDERARALIERILNSPVDPDWEYETRRDREIARTLLERLDTSDG
jgi:hypothetical protein